jgi:hypothetical protein
MRDGLLYDKQIESRFDSLETLIIQSHKAEKERDNFKKVINERINKIINLYGDK